MIERTFIKKNFNRMDLENYLSKKLDRAGFSHLEIIKTPLVTRIVLHVAKPGLAIGKSGATIKELTEIIGKDFDIDNPQIEISEIKNPNLNAKIVVGKMASMINRGFSWRSVAFRTMKDINAAGAQGIELVFKGALGGKGARKRKQRIAVGYMKKIGDQSKFVDTAKASANPKCGAIGIKLNIIHPEVVFPDKISVVKVVNDIKAVKAQEEEQKKETIENETKTEEEKETIENEEKKEEEKDETTKEEKKTENLEEKTPKTKEEKEITKTEKKSEEKEEVLNKAAHKVEEAIEDVEEVAEKVIQKVEEKIEDTEKTQKKEEKK